MFIFGIKYILSDDANQIWVKELKKSSYAV